MERYESYKDSGVEWIGEIPEGWETVRAKTCVKTRQNGNWGDEERAGDIDIPCLRAADFNYQCLCFNHPDTFVKRAYNEATYLRYLLEPGDIVVEKSGGGAKVPVGRALLFRGGYGACFSNFLERIRVDEEKVAPAFFFYWWTMSYQAGWFIPFFSQTTGIQNLNTGELLSQCFVPLPPLAEQRAIADYLDAKTAEIDAAVADVERSIGLLGEYRRSVVSEAVTKGLDPDAPMKDSGVEWIGEIPEGWEISRLKQQLVERKEVNNPVKTDFILSLTNTKGVIPYSEKGDIGNKSKDDLTGYHIARPGDIVLNSMNVIIGSVGLSNYFGAVSPVYYTLFPRNPSADVRFFNYIFQMPAFQDSLKGLGNGIMEIRMRIPMSKLNDVLLPVPSHQEQMIIADYLDAKTAEIDVLIADKRRQVDLLKEYRKSLISEAVTGKFKVPGLE